MTAINESFQSNQSNQSTPSSARRRARKPLSMGNESDVKKFKKMSEKFVCFFQKKEKTVPRTLSPISSMPWLKPFQINDGVTLAPTLVRPKLVNEHYNAFLTSTQVEESDYLRKIKKRNLVGVSKLNLAVPFDGSGTNLFTVGRMKLLQFHTNQRPAYYGTFRRRSKHIKGRRPFSTVEKAVNYEEDSDLEWEEDPSDAEECDSESGEGKENEEDEDDREAVEEGWLVQDGYMSADEGEEPLESKEDVDKRATRLAHLEAERKADRKETARRRKIKNLTPLIYGPCWGPPSKAAIDENPELMELMAGFLFDYPRAKLAA